jgi:hypothetical protein
MRDSLFLKPFYNSRGDARLNFILAIIIVAAIIYIIMQVAPVWIDYYGLKDYVTEQAQYGSCRDVDSIKENIVKKIKEYPNTVVKEDQVKVSCDGGIMKVQASYRRRLELPGYSRNLAFDIDTGVRKF